MRIPGPSRKELDELGDRFVEDVMRGVRNAVKTATRGLTEHSGPDDLGVIRRSWEAHLDRTLMPVLQHEWAHAAGTQKQRIQDTLTSAAKPELALGIDAEITSIAATQYLETARNRLVGVGNETWMHARDQLIDGTRAGESITQLRDRVSGATGLAEPRATVIARTEVIGASNRGSLEQMNSAGLPETKKTWLATSDNRTRPTHADVNGTTILLSEKFEVDGQAMDGPHDPGAPPGETINCRCTLTYEITSEPAGAMVAAADVATGAMLALVPSDADLSRLAMDGGEPIDQLHLTLCYLGDAIDYDEVLRSRISMALAQELAGSTPIAANGFGAALWNPDGPDPAWVLNVGEVANEKANEQTGAWDLEIIHDLVKEMFESMSVQTPDQHEPWAPHVCLIYSSDTGLITEMIKRVGPVTFDKLRIAFAGEITDITLA